jgi:hypothetical protein
MKWSILRVEWPIVQISGTERNSLFEIARDVSTSLDMTKVILVLLIAIDH